MKVVIRTDASIDLGTGHVIRCLTLADALRRRGADVVFACVAGPGDLHEIIERRGYRSLKLARVDQIEPLDEAWPSPPAPDWIVVDHYRLDAAWETSARRVAPRVLVLDDLADRPHDCDILVDPLFGEDGSRYRGFVPASCRGFFGTNYALLRPEFSAARTAGLPPWPGERRIHLFFGGSDPSRCTERFARLLVDGLADSVIEVVAGPTYPYPEGLAALAKKSRGRIRFSHGVNDMTASMLRCAVAVGAPGTAAWERACLGLPAAYLGSSPNQEPILRAMESRGLCRWWGPASAIGDYEFVERVTAFLADDAGLRAMRAVGLAAVDGSGADRVAAAMFES